MSVHGMFAGFADQPHHKLRRDAGDGASDLVWDLPVHHGLERAERRLVRDVVIGRHQHEITLKHMSDSFLV